MKVSPRLIFRADASPRMGTGHVMRCLALAQACVDRGGAAAFWMKEALPQLEARLKTENIPVFFEPDDAAGQKKILEWQADWIVLDGYHFSPEDRKRLGAIYPLLLMDDLGSPDGSDGFEGCGAILNQNAHASSDLYPGAGPKTELLLGNAYTLLRKEFLAVRERVKGIEKKARRLLVTLGGASSNGILYQVLRFIEEIKERDVEVKIASGFHFEPDERLKNFIATSHFSLEVAEETALKPSLMPSLMKWADLAVSAAGGTAWELAFCGVPTLLIAAAENQLPTARWMNERTAALFVEGGKDFGDRFRFALKDLLRSQERRRKLSQNSSVLVDGRGAERILMRLQESMIRLRPVMEIDCEVIWEWSNDPEIRAASFSSRAIPWEEHVAWFRSKWRDPNCLFYVACDQRGERIGQVRFEKEDVSAVISVSIAGAYRRSGLGAALIHKASEEFLQKTGTGLIHAYIKQDNLPSLHAFRKAGYQEGATDHARPGKAYHLIMRREQHAG